MTPVPSLTLYDALRAGTNTAVFEGLQSQLKMRDGEVQQLQNQLASEEKTRNSLTRELTQLISSNEDLSRRLARLEPLQTQLSELQTNYNALLQVTNPYITTTILGFCKKLDPLSFNRCTVKRLKRTRNSSSTWSMSRRCTRHR